MTRALFVSDIHISSAEDPKCLLFLRLLKTCEERRIEQLFLVGDIFDLWIADRRFFVERYSLLIEQLRKLVCGGCQVHYFEGNHDLDLELFWQKQVGVEVHTQAQYFALSGMNVRVEHGDQMDPEDRGYIFLRWLLRTPLMKWVIINLPGVVVAKIGQTMSKTSRVYTNSLRDPKRILSLIHTHAQKSFSIRAFQVIITGHVHLRDETAFAVSGQKMVSYNLGSWDDKFCVLKKDECGWSWLDLSK